MKTVRAAPRAAALIEGMRDFGYSLETALADIIDNSITAGASNVEIHAELSSDDPVIAIQDDGTGMTSAELLDAMVPGSQNPLDVREVGDLGRFGLGMKTASYSQCRRLTVVTRKEGVLSAARWDLDVVAKTDEWDLGLPEPSGVPFVERLIGDGTVVVWEKLDRLIGDTSAKGAQQGAVDAFDRALDHLSLVFHRFIQGERDLGKVRIAANLRDLEPLDPFRSDHTATTASPVESIGQGPQEIRVQAFTLPHHSKVSAADWKRYGGSEGWVKNQGFYVYRGGRLIIHGTWFRLARQQPLTQLSRVKIDLPNSLDSDWKIDVKKSYATPPPIVREKLRALIETILNTATRVYTHKGARLNDGNQMPVWTRLTKDGYITFTINRDHPLINTAQAGKDGEQVARAISLIEGSLPLDALLAALGNDPESVTEAALTEEDLRGMIEVMVAKLATAGSPDDEIRTIFSNAPPFSAYPELTTRVLDSMKIGQGTNG
jgi:hypothetical protein